MFALADHLLHLEGEALPRDVDARAAAALLARGAACRAPVRGAVYGTLLNDRGALDALGEAMHDAPYKAPPKAPVLYLKPRNTLADIARASRYPTMCPASKSAPRSAS